MVAMLAVLSGVVTAGVRSARVKAFDTQARSCAQQIRTSQEISRNGSGHFRPYAQLTTMTACRNLNPRGNATDVRYSYAVRHPNGKATYTVTDSEFYTNGVSASGRPLTEDPSRGQLGPPIVDFPNPPLLPGQMRVNLMVYSDEGELNNTWAATLRSSGEPDVAQTCAASPCTASMTMTKGINTIGQAAFALDGQRLTYPSLYEITTDRAGDQPTYQLSSSSVFHINYQPGSVVNVTVRVRPVGMSVLAENDEDVTYAADWIRRVQPNTPSGNGFASSVLMQWNERPAPPENSQCTPATYVRDITQRGLNCANSPRVSTFTGNSGRQYVLATNIPTDGPVSLVNCPTLGWTRAVAAYHRCGNRPPLVSPKYGSLVRLSPEDLRGTVTPHFLRYRYPSRATRDAVMSGGTTLDLTVLYYTPSTQQMVTFTVLRSMQFAAVPDGETDLLIQAWLPRRTADLLVRAVDQNMPSAPCRLRASHTSQGTGGLMTLREGETVTVHYAGDPSGPPCP